MHYSENPFLSAPSRDIVDDANFIGREYNIQHIEDRVVLPKRQRASIAIIGLPDVGKHSLINRTLLAHKAEHHQRKLLPIEIDLTTYTESDKHDKFFRDLISLCKYELDDEDLQLTVSQVATIAQTTQNALKEWDDSEGRRTISPLKGFFKHVLKMGVQVIFILDNFDHADSLFKEHISRIKWLRDLAGSECRITWIALACKPIREIKRLPKSISDDFFQEHRLGMFTQEDLETYFHALDQMGVSLSEEHKKMVTAYCGRHPYFLSLLGYHLIEDYAHLPGKIDIVHTFYKVEERFNQSYERILNLVLDNDHRAQKLSHMLFDPKSHVEQKDIDRMLAYDLIYPNSAWSPSLDNIQPAYMAFSEHFQNYLYARLSSEESLLTPENAEQTINWEDVVSGNRSLHPGDCLWKRYMIHECLKPTGHSQVVKAWDKTLKRFAAIKIVCLDPANGAAQRKRFEEWLEREARIVCGIDHENIAQVYDLRENAIIMKWIDGKSLDHLWVTENGEAGLSATIVMSMGIKLAKALEHVHNQGIVHRDIKPQNIIIRKNGEPVLIDFDAARAVGKEESILSNHKEDISPFVGTPAYSAPEQSSNPYNITPRADIYALGVVFYEAITGGDKPYHPYYWEKSPDARVSMPLWSILRLMLSENPQDRPNAQQLSQLLEHCLLELEKH